MIIFLGLLYSPDDEKRILASAKRSFQAAANKFQWGILNGLHQASSDEIVVLNSVPMGTYPKHSSILFEKASEVSTNNIKIKNCGYINLPLLKQFQRKRQVYYELKKQCKRSNEPIKVILYSLYPPYLKALKKLKKKSYGFNYISIVPDLPGTYGLNSGSSLRTAIDKHTEKSLFDTASYADAFVFLTEQMRAPLTAGDKPYTVVEGVYEQDDGKTASKQIASYMKSILYTGALDRSLGTETLLDAFERLPKGSAVLKIAGRGNYETELRERCKNNQDIHYLGFVSKDEVQHLQNEAAILVNPRSAKEEYTKYSFPSKTMEYLASGKPVVMNKLPGIPREYYEHIYFTETNDADGLTAKLLEVLQADPEELHKKGEKARAFILKEKNGATQAKKILKLIDSL